jgi:hypothetical protein
MCTVSSHHESHGVKGGEAVPHVCGGPPRARHHAPAKLLEPRQEEHDPPARDDDERQGDEPDAHVHHQHLRPSVMALQILGVCLVLPFPGATGGACAVLFIYLWYLS